MFVCLRQALRDALQELASNSKQRHDELNIQQVNEMLEKFVPMGMGLCR